MRLETSPPRHRPPRSIQRNAADGADTRVPWCVQGHLAHKKLPPPQDYHRALGIALLQGPKGRRFRLKDLSCDRRTPVPHEAAVAQIIHVGFRGHVITNSPTNLDVTHKTNKFFCVHTLLVW